MSMSSSAGSGGSASSGSGGGASFGSGGGSCRCQNKCKMVTERRTTSITPLAASLCNTAICLTAGTMSYRYQC